jgi:uroporphyrin-3 C-methyltransferase
MANQADDNLPPENSDSVTIPVKPRCSLWANIGILCSAFAFIVLITAYYIGYNRLIQNNQDLAALTTGLNSKIAQDQADIAGLQKTVADNTQQMQSALTSQQQVIGELKSTQQGKQESWSVSEAQYLTNLANDNLQVGDNIALVISLLQTADQKMRDLANANVLPVRKALAADIAALQAVPAVDLAGVYADVLALNSQVDKLPLPNKRPASDQASTDNADTQKISWWRNGLHQSWDALRKIVVVRYNKPGERPFIPPDQQDFLYQNLHATFEQALSAVVHRQPEIYRASLQQGAAWIQQYFLTDSPVTQAELSSITKLQAVTLRPELPNISASLQAFHDYFGQSDAAVKSTEAPATQS